MKTLLETAQDLEAGHVSSRDLVERCLDAISDPMGQGGNAFTLVNADAARAQADQIDHGRKAGRPLSKWAGIPISIKDLFDVEGQVTTAGSRVLSGEKPASQDAAIVARLRAAGFILIGRTNMTEFAYSGLGLNQHYGTPLSPYDRAVQRIPGGSSSGAAVAVADGMALASVGTDTGGSCRIPAAFCGIVGFKPTARRVPTAGAYPLSHTLDSVGPLANSVGCCEIMDSLMAGQDPKPSAPSAVTGKRFGVLRNYVQDGMDDTVASVFEAALDRLSAAGAILVEFDMPDLDDLPSRNARGGIVAAEAHRLHQDLLATRFDAYDPRVSVRIKKGTEQSPDEYQSLLDWRADVITRANEITEGFEAVLMPTVPIIPPLLACFDDEAEYGRLNLLTLRNPTVGNFLDRCAISLPIHAAGEAPVGLMLMGETLCDDRLLSTAKAVEGVFS